MCFSLMCIFRINVTCGVTWELVDVRIHTVIVIIIIIIIIIILVIINVCFHPTLCFFLLIALEAMFFGLKACVSWELNSCRRYLTKQLSLLYPVHTRSRCRPWPRPRHAPWATTCARHGGILFILSFQTFPCGFDLQAHPRHLCVAS